MTAAEIVSNIVALIALLVSFFGLYQENKAERRAHEFDLFRDVYKDYMIKRLPEARNKITLTSNSESTQFDELIEVLQDLRKASIYFKYAEPNFFTELRDKLWALEDYLVKLPDHLCDSSKVIVGLTMNAFLQEIYKCLLKKF